MDGRAWWATVHGVAKSQTRLSNFTFQSEYQKIFFCVWIKKTRYPVSRNLALFYIWEYVRVWAHWNHSLHVHLSYLGCSDMYFSHPEFQWELISLVQGCSVKLYKLCSMCVCLVVQLCLTLWLCGLQNARFPCPSPSPRACSNPCSLSRLCHPTTSSSVVPFSSCLQCFPASRSFPMSWLFASGDQGIGASASASILPMNIQGLFPLGWTGLFSLQSKGLSRVFSSTTVQRHQFVIKLAVYILVRFVLPLLFY